MKELRKDCKYALLVPTSMGVRITPPDGQPVYASDKFFMQATSAETNVASISSYLVKLRKALLAGLEDIHEQHKFDILRAALLASCDSQGIAVMDGKTVGLCKYAVRNA